MHLENTVLTRDAKSRQLHGDEGQTRGRRGCGRGPWGRPGAGVGAGAQCLFGVMKCSEIRLRCWPRSSGKALKTAGSH